MFSAEQLRAPVLLFMHGGNSTAQFAAETIGALRLNKKPFEFIFFPRGTHQLQSPRERYASLSTSVDWMGFWLKGEIPKDLERAARWAILRKQQDEVLKTPPPPKGKWVFVPDAVQPEWHPPAESKKEEKAESTSSNTTPSNPAATESVKTKAAEPGK